MNTASAIQGATQQGSAQISITWTAPPSEAFADVLSETADAAQDTPVDMETSPETGETEASSSAQTDSSSAESQLNNAISNALNDSLINQALSSTATGSTAGYNSYNSSVSGLGIESMLLSSAADGQISDTQLALFMLCMMMSMSGGSSDSSALTNVMAALMSNLQSETQASDSESEDGRTTPTVNGWGSSSQSSGWSGDVKQAAQPETSGTGSAVLPTNAWVATTPAILNTEGNRSASSLRSVLDQFNVETASRYARKNGNTYCNIFVWDATSALGCEVPHYVDAATGQPRTYPDVSGARELDANGVHDWLATSGAQYGWTEITAEQAQQYANKGYPVVSAWKNGGGIGHVSMVCPSRDGTYDAAKGPTVTQAGGTNSNYTYQSNVYRSSRLPYVRYFVHS